MDTKLTIFGEAILVPAGMQAEIHPPVGIPGMSVTISGGRRTGQIALTGRAANVLTANDRPWRARSGSKRFFRSDSEPNTRTGTKNIP